MPGVHHAPPVVDERPVTFDTDVGIAVGIVNELGATGTVDVELQFGQLRTLTLSRDERYLIPIRKVLTGGSIAAASLKTMH